MAEMKINKLKTACHWNWALQQCFLVLRLVIGFRGKMSIWPNWCCQSTVMWVCVCVCVAAVNEGDRVKIHPNNLIIDNMKFDYRHECIDRTLRPAFVVYENSAIKHRWWRWKKKRIGKSKLCKLICPSIHTLALNRKFWLIYWHEFRGCGLMFPMSLPVI